MFQKLSASVRLTPAKWEKMCIPVAGMEVRLLGDSERMEKLAHLYIVFATPKPRVEFWVFILVWPYAPSVLFVPLKIFFRLFKHK